MYWFHIVPHSSNTIKKRFNCLRSDDYDFLFHTDYLDHRWSSSSQKWYPYKVHNSILPCWNRLRISKPVYGNQSRSRIHKYTILSTNLFRLTYDCQQKFFYMDCRESLTQNIFWVSDREWPGINSLLIKFLLCSKEGFIESSIKNKIV
jgi:hypothetical protein